ncbi:hypothetical protein C8R46DRAFT_604606 [Mycena filopes]|nr:hypothetical protein C8R46DRAFT_604606 [Mycena filopes]
MSLDPTLPLDLERQIFELCAESRPVLIPKLMLVAWRVKEWVEPLLYRTIALHGSLDIDGYPIFTAQRLLHAMYQNSALFGNSVRNLYLYQPRGLSSANPSILRILSYCSGVTNLTLGARFGHYEAPADRRCIEIIAKMPLTRLHSDSRTLLRLLEPNNPLFTTLTHLGLSQASVLLEPEALCARLAQLPSLTHLAVDHRGMLQACCPALLQMCAALRVLVFFMPPMVPHHESVTRHFRALAQDPRFLVMHSSWHVEDWHIGVRENLDFWARAEDFIARRRTGEIDRVLSIYSPSTLPTAILT